MKFLIKRNKNISLKLVQLGQKKFNIPVAEFEVGANKTIVITAGVDGDEYAGIEAAYRLINYFSNNTCQFNILIIPIVNMPGFLSGVSWNPLDNKFPKHIYPGKKTGSGSEQLIHWLAQLVEQSCLWIDLHSGASTEVLHPFIWTWKTKNEKVDQLTRFLLSANPDSLLLFDKNPYANIKNLAKKNIPYIVLESGQKGEVEERLVEQHIVWVKNIIAAMEISSAQGKKITVYQSVFPIYANQEGRWQLLQFPRSIKKGQEVGKLVSLTGRLSIIKAKESGVVLYAKSSMTCKKGDELFVIATNREILGKN